MTSTAPGAHPAPEEVDALLDPSGGDARVGAHVAVCDRCAEVREDLLLVRSLLGDQARTPPPEPADLGTRIAAALAAEPPLTGRADPAEAARGRSGDRDRGRTGTIVVPLHSRRRRPWTTWLAAAASVAVLGAGGTVLVTQLGPGGSEATSAGSDAAPQSELAEGGVQQDQESAADTPTAPSDPSASVPTGTFGATALGDEAFVSSGRAYDAADLSAQALALVSAAEAGSATGPRSAPDASYQVAAASTLDACLVAVGRPGAEPVVTDLATFEGSDAAVVVIPDDEGYEVLVVPAACGAGEDRVLASARLR